MTAYRHSSAIHALFKAYLDHFTIGVRSPEAVERLERDYYNPGPDVLRAIALSINDLEAAKSGRQEGARNLKDFCVAMGFDFSLTPEGQREIDTDRAAIRQEHGTFRLVKFYEQTANSVEVAADIRGLFEAELARYLDRRARPPLDKDGQPVLPHIDAMSFPRTPHGLALYERFKKNPALFRREVAAGMISMEPPRQQQVQSEIRVVMVPQPLHVAPAQRTTASTSSTLNAPKPNTHELLQQLRSLCAKRSVIRKRKMQT